MRRVKWYKSVFGVLLLSSVACNSKHGASKQSLRPSAQQDKATAASQPTQPADKGGISYAKNPDRFVQMPVVKPPFNLKDPETPADYFDLGVHEDNLHHYENAISAYERGLKLKPDWALLVLREAKDYRRLGRTQDAIVQLKRATKIDPHYWDAYSELALTYKDSRDTKNAIKAASKLLEFPPLQIPTHNQLGYWYEEIGDKAMAKQQFELYRGLAQKSPTESSTERYQSAMQELNKLGG
jgi:tetratricopeptide (TPR) repeat protein